MSTRPASRAAAAQTAPRRPQVYHELSRLSSRLDALLGAASVENSSQREFERQCEEAEAIASGLRAAFRGQAGPEPSCPPLAFESGIRPNGRGWARGAW